MPVPRRTLLAFAPTLLAPALARPAGAEQAWPDRPVRLIVPFPAGSTPDIAGRAIASHFGQVLSGSPAWWRTGPGQAAISAPCGGQATDGHIVGSDDQRAAEHRQGTVPRPALRPGEGYRAVSLLVRARRSWW